MIKWATLHEWQQDWERPSQEAIDKRLKLFDRAPSILRSQFVTSINLVRAGHERFVANYGFSYADQLEHDSSVASTPHLNRLLEIAQRRLGSPYLQDQVWFEAVSMFDQALGVQLIEQHEPMEHVGNTVARLIDLLAEELFVGGFEKLDVYAYHDPMRHYLVAEGNVGINQELNRPGLSRRKKRLNCRRVKNDGITFLHHRLKDPFRTWLKIQRQIQKKVVANPFEVSDRCGLMFCAPTIEDALELAREVIDLLLAHGATIVEPLEDNFYTSVALDEHNSDSSADHKSAKALIYWNDQKIELQFLTLAGYFTSLRSLNDTNHELYKLKQAIRYFFPLLWPHSRFDVDWSSPNVRGALRAWKVSQLGWAIKEPE